MKIEIRGLSKIYPNGKHALSDMNLTIWMTVVHQNRLILGIGSIIALLWALTNLQRREKFV